MTTLGNPYDERTYRYVARELLGSSWLGRASLEEYAVAQWFEISGLKGPYQYQSIIGDFTAPRHNASGRRTKGSFRNPLKADFLLLNGTKRVIEVQGDTFHAGKEQVADDRARAVLLRQLGYDVVNVWGNAIRAYPGFPVPTNESFDRVMQAAVEGHELSSEHGGRFLGQQFH